LLGDGDNGIKIVYSEENNFFIGLTTAAKAELKSLVPAPTKEGPFSFVFFESPFTSVSTGATPL
jgi:hypothetical protein